MQRRPTGLRAESKGLSFTPTERRLIARLRTPLAVQRYLNALPYNTEPPPGRATLRSFRGVVRHHTAHCLEAALFAATVLEQHGYPPLVISFESIDELDHVIFVYQSKAQSPRSKAQGLWGSVARSRDHVRRPDRPHSSVRARRSPRNGRIRLAAVGEERMESRAHAARHEASTVDDVGREISRFPSPVPCL
jgi:hypothetical protein